MCLVAVMTQGLVCSSVWAQSAPPPPGLDQEMRRNVLTVIFASLGGAVLGLSTLSFYGSPQEHTGNITNGLLLGFAGGVGYVVYDNSPKQRQFRHDIYEGVKRFGPPTSVPVAQYTFRF